MVKLTMIARVLDGLPLAEGLDTDASIDLEYYKQQAKTLFKKLSHGPGVPPSRMSYESGEYFMHYVIESGVCYLTLCDRNYPKKLAYSYLEGERERELLCGSRRVGSTRASNRSVFALARHFVVLFLFVMSPPRFSSKFVVLVLTRVSFLSLSLSLSVRLRVKQNCNASSRINTARLSIRSLARMRLLNSTRSFKKRRNCTRISARRGIWRS